MAGHPVKFFCIVGILVTTLLATSAPLFADMEIVAAKSASAPEIDGRADDLQWRQSRPYIVRDRVADIDVTLQAVHTPQRIFFLVRFPDKDESRMHKPWVWNKAQERYEIGPLREDTFVFKWSMSGNQVDLSIHGDTDHTADIWFWKANRTDPEGYADDKNQHYGLTRRSKAKTITIRSGKTGYLTRRGDKGSSAYQTSIQLKYQGGMIEQFHNRTPSGSRADIRAKGSWADNQWTVEFSRRLDTGHADDIRFEIGKSYLFGISRYEIAGRDPDPALNQPDFGAGDVSEPLILILAD